MTGTLLCDAGCYTPSVVTLAPGGSYTESWDGRAFVPAAMPASCYSVPAQAPAACPRRVVPPAGTYSFSAVAGGTCDACTCTPASGWCISPVADAGVSGESLSATVAAELPGATSIKLVFQ